MPQSLPQIVGVNLPSRPLQLGGASMMMQHSASQPYLAPPGQDINFPEQMRAEPTLI